jgi:hypothetical protein
MHPPMTDTDAPDEGPSPQDPSRFVEGGNAPLDAGPNATPGDADDPDDDKQSLPPGAGTKDEPDE